MEITVLKRTVMKGQYDFDYETKLVRQGDKYYLVEDEYCGDDGLEGGMPRPMLYKLTRAQAEQLEKDWDEAMNIDITDYFYYRLFGGSADDFEAACLGRAWKYSWGKALADA